MTNQFSQEVFGIYSRNYISNNYVSRTKEENKLIEGDKLCPITYQEIKEKDKYMSCNYCNKNFMENELNIWLAENNTCPTCRENWTNNIIYINQE